jgi:hypothetical protein
MFAAPWSPTRCKRCGLLSSERMTATRIVNGVVGGGPFLVLYAVLVYQSWWPAILFVAFVLIAYLSILIFSPLHPLSSEGVSAAKSGRVREAWFVLLGLGAVATIGLLAN